MARRKIEYSVADRYHSGLTVAGLFSLWFPFIRNQISSISYHNYELIVARHILPSLGNCEIDYLTVADIDDFLAEKLKSGRIDGKGGLSEKTVRDISSILHSALKFVAWNQDLPESDHAFVNSQHAKRGLETLTIEQAEILTKYLTQHLNRSNAGFLLCLFTGIKLSEVCSLKDSDFQLEQDIIQIRRTLQRVTMLESSGKQVQEKTVDYTPSDSNYRDLAVPTRLSMLIWSILRQSSGDSFFLTSSPSTPLGTRAYQYRFQKVLTDCGLPTTVNFHMLRHTFALLWMLRCDDLPGLSKALGHASIKVTQNRYSKILDTVEACQPACSKYLCLSVE